MPRGGVNGPELHWGGAVALCVCGPFSAPEVPITDYPTREETEQGLTGLARLWGNAT